MELELIETPSEHFLCDRYTVGPLASSHEFIDAYRALKSLRPDACFLFTLDDLPQACYTSMHAKGSHDLDDTAGFDLGALGPECFEEGAHKGYLTSKSELFIREAHFLRGARETSLEDVLSKQLSPYDESIDDFVSANRNIAEVLDKETYALAVERPHGYFRCDLNPFETFVMARHMQEEFGYVLVGIGASRIAFLATEKLDEPGVQRLMAFLARLYASDWDEALHAAAKDCVSKGGLLVLRYTE